MDKTFLKRGMASALSLVMAFSTAVPSSLVYAEEPTGIESEITRGPGENVKLAVEPAEGFNAAKVEVKDADGAVVASLEGGQVTEKDGTYNFAMPESNVIADVAFEAAPAETKTAPKTEVVAKEEAVEAETKTTTETKTEEKETRETKIQIFEEFLEK